MVPNDRKAVYICHPYAGEGKNRQEVSKLILDLSMQYPDMIFVSGIHAFGFCYFNMDYLEGLNMCLWLLGKTDEMWVYGDYTKSRGCKAEMEFCIANHIPYFVKNKRLEGSNDS